MGFMGGMARALGGRNPNQQPNPQPQGGLMGRLQGLGQPPPVNPNIPPPVNIPPPQPQQFGGFRPMQQLQGLGQQQMPPQGQLPLQPKPQVVPHFGMAPGVPPVQAPMGGMPPPNTAMPRPMPLSKKAAIGQGMNQRQMMAR